MPLEFQETDVEYLMNALTAWNEMHSNVKGKPMSKEEVKEEHKRIKEALGDPKDFLPPGARVLNW